MRSTHFRIWSPMLHTSPISPGFALSLPALFNVMPRGDVVVSCALSYNFCQISSAHDSYTFSISTSLIWNGRRTAYGATPLYFRTSELTSFNATSWYERSRCSHPGSRKALMSFNVKVWSRAGGLLVVRLRMACRIQDRRMISRKDWIAESNSKSSS